MALITFGNALSYRPDQLHCRGIWCNLLQYGRFCPTLLAQLDWGSTGTAPTGLPALFRRCLLQGTPAWSAPVQAWPGNTWLSMALKYGLLLGTKFWQNHPGELDAAQESVIVIYQNVLALSSNSVNARECHQRTSKCRNVCTLARELMWSTAHIVKSLFVHLNVKPGAQVFACTYLLVREVSLSVLLLASWPCDSARWPGPFALPPVQPDYEACLDLAKFKILSRLSASVSFSATCAQQNPRSSWTHMRKWVEI